MAQNTLVSLTNDIYWDGDYSRCHVGNAIETYLRESIQRTPVPLTVVFPKSDGFISRTYLPNETNPVLPSETKLKDLESRVPSDSFPVVAALCSRGIDQPNILYLPLDDETFKNGLTKVLSSVPSPAWEARRPVAFWRGGASGVERPSIRVRVVLELDGDPGTDVRITPWGNWEREQNIPPHLFAPRCGLAEHFQCKYLLIVDGNCIASNHQWVFGSGAVPIMITHPENRYWFQRYLKPMVNYVPIKYDLSDLKEKISWLREHDTEAKQIAENALAFSCEVFSPEFQRKYIDDELSRCAGKIA